MPYTGQTNALGLAHGHGVLTSIDGGTLRGVFIDGAPSIGIFTSASGEIFMATYDTGGKVHGRMPSVSASRRSVSTHNHGRSLYGCTDGMSET